MNIQKKKEESAYHRGYRKGFRVASSISIGMILLFELAHYLLK